MSGFTLVSHEPPPQTAIWCRPISGPRLVHVESTCTRLFSSLMMTTCLLTQGRDQPVTHMRSTNSKPQPSNQFHMDKIKSRPTCFLIRVPFHTDLYHNRKERTYHIFHLMAINKSLRLKLETKVPKWTVLN